MKRNILNQASLSQSSKEQLAQNPEVIISVIRSNQSEGVPLIADLLRRGIEDESVQTDYPDKFVSVFLLLINFWVKSIIGPKLDKEEIQRHYRFSKELSAKIGVDILSNDWSEEVIIQDDEKD